MNNKLAKTLQKAANSIEGGVAIFPEEEWAEEAGIRADVFMAHLNEEYNVNYCGICGWLCETYDEGMNGDLLCDDCFQEEEDASIEEREAEEEEAENNS